MPDYSLLRSSVRPPAEIGAIGSWDVFLSAFNSSERVNTVFDKINAASHHWLIHPEYGFTAEELPHGEVFDLAPRDEAEWWWQYFDEADIDSWDTTTRICVDVTGFMRPHLMILPKLLSARGFTRLDAIYTDPVAYKEGASTPFSKGAVTEVRQVRGFEGPHEPEAGDRDLLIIGAGYDDELIRCVAEAKRSARKTEVFGLPSLQPHMYEENQLQAAKAEEAVGPISGRSIKFAPANNPFVTAEVLQEIVVGEEASGLNNLYLSPLATKPQALGFALYYLCECAGQPASIIFPFREYYERETAVGITRVSLFELELDWFAQ